MPDPYTIDPSGLDVPEAMNTPITGRLPNRQDALTIAGHVGKGIVKLAGTPTGLYGLTSDALQWLTKDATTATTVNDYAGGEREVPAPANPQPGYTLPGAEGAHRITDAIDKSAQGFGSFIAERDIQTGLIGDNTTADKIGTGLAILGSLVPVTGGPIKTGFEALKNIKTGVEAVDKTVKAATEFAAFATPFIPTNSPRTLIAGNAVIGGGAQIAIDTVTPHDNVATVDPDFKIAMDQFIQQTEQAHSQLNGVAATNSNKAVDGVGEISNQVSDLNQQHEMEQFIAGLPSTQKVVTAGVDFDLGEHKTLAAAATAIAIAAGAAYLHRDVIRGASLRFLGGKEFSKDAKLDFVTKPDDTALSIADVAKSQAVNAATPLVRNTKDPEHIQAMFENIGAAKDVHFTQLQENGQFANSGVRLNQPMNEFIDYMREKIASDPVKHQLFQDTANAISELGNRNRKWLADFKPPGLTNRNVMDPLVSTGYKNWLIHQGGSEADTAFNMAGTPYRSLEATRIAGLADPDIKQGLDMYADVTRKSLQYRLEQGVNTLREYHDMMRNHPVYFPVRQAGSHMSPLELSGGGGRIAAGDPLKELMPYLEQTVREVAESKLRTAFVLESKANRASFIGKELPVDSKNVMNRDKMVQYRDANANLRMIEVSDPMIRAALAPGAGSAMIRLNQGLLKGVSTPSRILETLTTHPLTAVVGSPFAVGNAMYGSTATLINRQAGMRAGWIDGFVQQHGLLGANSKGINRGVRGDPTFYAQVVAQAGSSFLARLAQYGGKAIENSAQSSWLAPSLAGPTLAKIGAAMSNHYKASMLHELNAQGLHGGATAMGRAQTYTLKDLENSLTPATRLSEGWRATSNFAWDLFRAIGDAPQAAYYKQNKGRVSQELLTTRTRNVMGDPTKAGLGTSGFGKAALEGVILHPWGSVTLQSISKLLESAHQNPLGTAMAIGNAIVIPSILVSNWNVSLGKAYTDYQHNQRTPDQVAGSLYFGIPGRPPEEGLEWRVDQPMRPFKVLADTLYGHLYGLHDGSVFKPENEFVRRALSDGVATLYGIWGDAMHSAVGQVLPAIPPIVTAPMNMAGVNVRSYTEGGQAIVDKNKSAGASDSTSKVIDNKWFGYPISANMEATLQNTTGQIGQAIYEMLTAHFQGKKDGLSAGDQASDYLDRFGMRLGQSSREVSGLWGHSATLSPSQESSAKALTQQMDSMRKLDAASQKLRGLSGSGDLLSGAKGREINALAGSGPVKFADQQMAALAFDAQRFVSVYDRQFSGRLKDLYEQRSSILSSEKVAPDVKHTMMNDNAKLIVDENRKALNALEQWKWRVSKTYNRNIDLHGMKLDAPITQFKSLLDQ